MRGLDIHKNIPVSVSKFVLGLRIGFISSHLTSDKLILLNPRATTGPLKVSPLLEAKSTPALIIKPSHFLVAHMDDYGWCIKFNQQGQMFVQNLKRIVSKQNATPAKADPVLHHRLYSN